MLLKNYEEILFYFVSFFIKVFICSNIWANCAQLSICGYVSVCLAGDLTRTLVNFDVYKDVFVTTQWGIWWEKYKLLKLQL